jgi:hypothetical protein
MVILVNNTVTENLNCSFWSVVSQLAVLLKLVDTTLREIIKIENPLNLEFRKHSERAESKSWHKSDLLKNK